MTNLQAECVKLIAEWRAVPWDGSRTIGLRDAADQLEAIVRKNIRQSVYVEKSCCRSSSWYMNGKGIGDYEYFSTRAEAEAALERYVDEQMKGATNER